MIPICVSSVQDFLNDRMVGSLGMSAASKYMPTLVNILFTLGLFGKLSFMDADMTMKVSTAWMGSNGLAGYFATDAWMDGWGGRSWRRREAGMAKLFALHDDGRCRAVGCQRVHGQVVLEVRSNLWGGRTRKRSPSSCPLAPNLPPQKRI